VLYYWRSIFTQGPLELFKGLQVYPCCADGSLERFGDSQLSPWAPAGAGPAKIRRPGGRVQPGADGGRPAGPWGTRFLCSIGVGAPPEGALGRAGWWPPRGLLLRCSCISGGAMDGSGGWGGGPRWRWCTQIGRWWLETGSSPWRPPWRPGGRLGAREEERRAGFIGGEWERESLLRC
jgi:hypothetical protein